MSDQPVESNLERELTAPLLQRILITVMVTGLLLSAASTAADFRKSLCLGLGNTVVAAAMLSLARRGHLLTASVVEVFALLFTTIFAMWTGEGVFDDSVLIIPGLFILSSLLLNRAWNVIVVVLALCAVAYVGMAQLRGEIGPFGKGVLSHHLVMEVVILLGALASFVYYLVTLMRRATVEARNAHESVRDILDATSEAIFIHDAEDGRVISVNETALAMFGYTRQEFIGLYPVDLKMPGDGNDDDVSTEYTKMAASESPQPFEWLARRKDGTSLWIEIALRSARISNRPRLIAVARDITARRQLESRVREAETFRAVGQLAGGVAHDFNNQLVGILGHAEFLREELQVDADLCACASSIIASGRRAADLTQKLLAFARRGRLRNVPVDVHQLITEVIELGKRSIDKRITIEQRLQAPRSTVLGDPSALQNALLNLLLNARDALPHGGTICFSTRVTTHRGSATAPSSSFPPGKQMIEIDVADTGVGVAPDVIGKIFEPFFTTKESGTGMGLSAVQGTVAEHQGSVDVQSELGKGSTFRLRLPLSDDLPKADFARQSGEKIRVGGRVMVVDDEPSVAKVCKFALERGGFEVEVCTGGRQALELYDPAKHDLILLDVMMPDVDGVEVLRQIRKINPTAKVMLMTGHASESVEERLREWSDVVVLSKPMMPKEILAAARNQLMD